MVETQQLKRGVLWRRQGACYLKDGKMVEIPAGGLLTSSQRMDFLPGFALEGFANRDSTVYGKLYGIPEAEVRGRLVRGPLCSSSLPSA